MGCESWYRPAFDNDLLYSVPSFVNIVCFERQRRLCSNSYPYITPLTPWFRLVSRIDVI
jgi:hypothetical protein